MSTPPYGWYGWEAETDLENDDDRKDVHYLTITQDGEEFAVIIHRTVDGKYPLDGALAKAKEATAQHIADALNAYEPTRTPAPDLIVQADSTCTKCGTKVTRDEQGSWVDETDGDGCDVGVHKGGPTDPRTICPYDDCGAVNAVSLVDIGERWNATEVEFKDGQLVALQVNPQDGDGYQTDRFICTACSRTITIPPDVEDVWP